MQVNAFKTAAETDLINSRKSIINWLRVHIMDAKKKEKNI